MLTGPWLYLVCALAFGAVGAVKLGHLIEAGKGSWARPTLVCTLIFLVLGTGYLLIGLFEAITLNLRK